MVYLDDILNLVKTSLKLRCLGAYTDILTDNLYPLPALPRAGGYTCVQRRSWGNCNADWFKSGPWCAATCGYCTPVDPITNLPPAPTCKDVPVPPGEAVPPPAGA